MGVIYVITNIFIAIIAMIRHIVHITPIITVLIMRNITLMHWSLLKTCNTHHHFKVLLKQQTWVLLLLALVQKIHQKRMIHLIEQLQPPVQKNQRFNLGMMNLAAMLIYMVDDDTILINDVLRMRWLKFKSCYAFVRLL